MVAVVSETAMQAVAPEWVTKSPGEAATLPEANTAGAAAAAEVCGLDQTAVEHTPLQGSDPEHFRPQRQYSQDRRP